MVDRGDRLFRLRQGQFRKRQPMREGRPRTQRQAQPYLTLELWCERQAGNAQVRRVLIHERRDRNLSGLAIVDPNIPGRQHAALHIESLAILLEGFGGHRGVIEPGGPVEVIDLGPARNSRRT
jgi:hypothetical protein